MPALVGAGQHHLSGLGLPTTLPEGSEKASDRSVPYELVDRREGDIAANWCDPARAERLLGWKASRTIDDMCRDAWNFESNKR